MYQYSTRNATRLVMIMIVMMIMIIMIMAMMNLIMIMTKIVQYKVDSYTFHIFVNNANLIFSIALNLLYSPSPCTMMHCNPNRDALPFALPDIECLLFVVGLRDGVQQSLSPALDGRQVELR